MDKFRKAVFRILGIFLILRILIAAAMPLADPSETRYACMARNMADSGNYLVPHFVHDGVYQSFDGKPPLYFQIAGVFCKALGNHELWVRLPSLLAAVGILLLLYRTARKLSTEHVALVSTAICAGSGVFWVFAGLSLTDMVLAFTIAGAIFAYMLFLAEKEQRIRKFHSLEFFFFLALGMVAKGPVALVYAGIPVAIYTIWGGRWRDLKDHAWITGTILFLAVASPWYILMTRENPDFLKYFFVHENFLRFVTPSYGDRYGTGRETFRGMALIWFLAVNLPGLLLLGIPAVFRKLTAWRKNAQNPMWGIAAAGCLGITLFWCLTARATIYYLLPSIPLAALLLGDALVGANLLATREQRIVFLKGIFVWHTMLFLGLLAATLQLMRTDKSSRNVLEAMGERIGIPAGRCYYFAKATPYSANFYAPERIVNHAWEPPEFSAVRSKSHYLILRAKDEAKAAGHLGERKLFLRRGEWAVYAPEKR
ncbi:MAG: glycosyltransferase family 39 protein [Victivallaceae bacterium]|nr:glycosyltransferase family 39 protein [Victivallaceae bacterium]